MEDVLLQLVGIRKKGRGVGSDLAFTINATEFQVKLTSKGVKMSKQIAIGRCPRNLRYAIRLKINVVESDPKYDDTATAYQTVVVPVGRAGTITTKMRLYEHRRNGPTDKFITIYFDFEWRRGNRQNILFAGEENILDEDSDNEPLPMPQEIEPCHKEHTVSTVSTLWIAPMNISKEMKAFKDAWLHFPDPAIQKVLNKQTSKKHGLLAFRAFANATNLLFSDTGDPSKPDSYRIAVFFNTDVEVRNGIIVNYQKGSFEAKGGKEGFGLEGSANAKILKQEVSAKSILIRYVVYGKPNVNLEFGFNIAYPRKSRYIWHYIEVQIKANEDCSITSKARFLTSSTFPSHRLWLNDVELPSANNNPFNNGQFDLIRLWDSASKNSEPLDKLPELQKHFSKKMWSYFVIPRSSSGRVLPWP